jgi:cycloeucalenol cycloisomerase
MEAWTLEQVPYYHIEDRRQMYLVGSTFYMLYFVVSFPMFTRYYPFSQKYNLQKNK